MNPFSTTFIVDYLNINPDATITLPRLMAYALEASLRHGNHAGYPMEWFSEHKQSFILTNWQIQVMAYPRWNRKIQVDTWPIRMMGFIAERAFKVTDTDGRLLLLANSSWVYMDIGVRKPSRITREMAENYGDLAPSELQRDYKLPPIEQSELQTVGENFLIATRRDIDTNLHVNNQKYLEWTLDYIPDDIYNTRRVVSMKVHYKKECMKGQSVLVETRRRISGNHGCEEFLTLIRDSAKREIIFTEVWSKWE